MKLKTFFLPGLLLLAVCGSTIAAPADWQKLVSGNNIFAVKLLPQLAHDEPGANIFISPYSASVALQITACGAAGQTQTEMQQVLGTTGLSATALGQYNKEISQSFGAGSHKPALTVANAIWYRHGTPVNPDFISNTRYNFDALVGPLDFSDPGSVKTINHWVSAKTHGKISQLLSGMLNPDDRLFLVNAVYFKDKWADPFDVTKTLDQPFYLRHAAPQNVPLMMKTKKFAYAEGANFQAVRLPYATGNIAMYVFLPATNSSPEELLSSLTGGAWQNILESAFSDRQGTLGLPRFRMDYEVELKGPLQALGMKSAFDPNLADFSGMGPNLYLSSVLQKTYVEVNEEGTEAAAATGVRVIATALEMPSEPFKMIVNRPFLFLIEDQQAGVILFMGLVFDPTAK